MGEQVSRSSTPSTQRTQLAYSARASRLKDYQRRDTFASAAQQNQQSIISSHCFRQFRHALNAKSGIDSLCLKCGEYIATTEDEWLLLEHERRHVCGKAQ